MHRRPLVRPSAAPLATLAGAALACALGAGVAAAQKDGGWRLRTVPGTPHRAVYEYATGRLRPADVPVALLGADVVYDNTCIPGPTVFAVLGPMESFVDHGRVPSSSSPLPPGCADVQLMDGFTFGYCTDQPVVDVSIAFFERHEACTDLSQATGSMHSYLLPGLPGTSTAIPTCWEITVDLAGSPDEWPFLADGDGTYQGDPAFDAFAVQIGFVSPPSPQTGVLVAGDPVHYGLGCDFAVGTVYQLGDPTGAGDSGTGVGTHDQLGLSQLGVFVGCFDLGGWPTSPWASLYLEMVVVDAGCQPQQSFFCGAGGGGGATLLGSITCPCGNDPPAGPPQGCLHSGGLGGKLTTHPSSGFSVSAEDLVLLATDLAVANGGLFFVGTGELASPMPLFDGVLCVGGSAFTGGTLRLNAGFESGPGTRTSNPAGPTSLIGEGNSISPGYFAPGVIYYWQYFFRDAAPGPGPCGGMANFTNGIAVVLGA